MSASPEDEFDSLPDAIDFGAISEADWMAMQNTPASSNINESQDSLGSDFDDDFLAHVDEIERQNSNRLPLTESARSNTCSPPPPFSPNTRRGKGDRSQTTLSTVLDEFGEELICSICYDYFVVPHTVNPCGHSFCGPCVVVWEEKRRTCPVCRKTVSATRPFITNVALDSIVQKHVEMLGRVDSNSGWQKEGAKYLEWSARQNEWKKNARS